MDTHTHTEPEAMGGGAAPGHEKAFLTAVGLCRIYHGIMGRLDFRVLYYLMSLLVLRCLDGLWNSDLMAGTFL